MKLLHEISIVVVLFLLTCFFAKDQKRISYNEGKGWDGVYYFECIEQIVDGNYKIEGKPPFVNRYANHLIIATFCKNTNYNIYDSALIVNLFGAFVAVILLVFWLRLFIISSWIRILLNVLFFTSWFGPVRFIFYYPIVPEPWGAVFFILGLILLNRIYQNTSKGYSSMIYILALSIVASVGTLFRESNAALAIAVLFVISPVKNLNVTPIGSNFAEYIKQKFTKAFKMYYSNLKLFIPIFSVLATSVVLSFIVTPYKENYLAYPHALIACFYSKTITAFLTGTFIAFGPLLVLTPFFYSQYKNVFKYREDLIFLIGISVFFGYFGGGDTERILYMSSFPVVFIAVGKSIEYLFQSSKRWWLFILIFFQIFAQRIFWYIPDYPNDYSDKAFPFFGLIGNKFQYLSLYSSYGNIYILTFLLAEYILLFVVTYFILRKRKELRS